MNSEVIEAVCGKVLDVCVLMIPILVSILMIAEVKRGESSTDSGE